MTPLFHLPGGPMQPAIPGFDMKGRRTEHQQCEPLAIQFGHVAQRPANHRCVLEIMFTQQQFIKPALFRRLDQPHADLPEQR
jgi:hypothetical protein